MAAPGGVWLQPALWGINKVPRGFWCAAGAVDRAFPEDMLPAASKQLVVWLGLSLLFFLRRDVRWGHCCSGCPGPCASHCPQPALNTGACQMNLLVLLMKLAAWSPGGIADCHFWGFAPSLLSAPPAPTLRARPRDLWGCCPHTGGSWFVALQ